MVSYRDLRARSSVRRFLPLDEPVTYTSNSPAREGLDREQQEILATLEGKRQEYEPLHKKADRAISAQMRVYNEILDLERRLTAINEAIKVVG